MTFLLETTKPNEYNFLARCSFRRVTMETWFCPSCGFTGADPECPQECPKCGSRAEKFECPQCNYVGYFLGKQTEFCPRCGEELTDREEDENALIDKIDEDIGLITADDSPKGEGAKELVEDEEEELKEAEEFAQDELLAEIENQELDFERQDFIDRDFLDEELTEEENG